MKDAESASVKLGNGVALFQALSNLAINSQSNNYYWVFHYLINFLLPLCVGVVLGVVCHGGLLLVSNQLSSGELMAFLVATQTIQRYSLSSRVHETTGCSIKYTMIVLLYTLL